MDLLKNSLHRRTGPFPSPPLFLGGGGTTYFARILYPCPKVEYVWPMHFCCTWEGGGLFGGGGEYLLYRRPRSGRVWDVDCFGFRGTKTRFLLWVVEFKLTSTLAPNVYNACNIRGDLFFLLKVLGKSVGLLACAKLQRGGSIVHQFTCFCMQNHL